jgi:hypothetical protein
MKEKGIGVPQNCFFSLQMLPSGKIWQEKPGKRA